MSMLATSGPADVVLHTACGREAGTPLADKRFEDLAGRLALGHSVYEALAQMWAEGIRLRNPNASSFKSNARRLLSEWPEIVERSNELAADGARLLGITAASVLKDDLLFARASLEKFWARGEDGKLKLEEYGDHRVPVLDFTHATADDIRTLGKLKFGKYGPEIELRDVPNAVQKLGEYFGLWKSPGASAEAKALSVTIMRFADTTERESAA
jgi:hypothetical protein